MMAASARATQFTPSVRALFAACRRPGVPSDGSQYLHITHAKRTTPKPYLSKVTTNCLCFPMSFRHRMHPVCIWGTLGPPCPGRFQVDFTRGGGKVNCRHRTGPLTPHVP